MFEQAKCLDLKINAILCTQHKLMQAKSDNFSVSSDQILMTHRFVKFLSQTAFKTFTF